MFHVQGTRKHQIHQSFSYGNLSSADVYQSPVNTMTQCI